MGLFKRFFQAKSHAEVIADIIYNLKLLAESEAEVAEFYGLCAKALVDEKDFWEQLSKSELRHQENIKKMIALIKKSPEDYKPGVSFSPASIRALRLRTGSLVQSIKAGTTPVEKLYSVADEIENSVVELEYSRIVKTDNAEFNKLVQEIATESQEHRDSVKAKIAAQGGP
jgi:rubrerythrin